MFMGWVRLFESPFLKIPQKLTNPLIKLKLYVY